MTGYESAIALEAAARSMFNRQDHTEARIVSRGILDALLDHRAYCEDYYNSLVEHDADCKKKREAQAHLNGVEECVNIVRRLIDGD